MRSDEMTAEVLMTAVLARLRDQGWIKGQIASRQGYCLVGAVCSLSKTPEVRRDAIETINEVVCEQFPERYTDPFMRRSALTADAISFNDHSDTTFSDVELVLEKAIAKLEER